MSYILYRGIESLVVVPISQVSSDQRAGRAGMYTLSVIHIDTAYTVYFIFCSYMYAA